MTVKQLINLLNQVEDKTLPVFICDENRGLFNMYIDLYINDRVDLTIQEDDKDYVQTLEEKIKEQEEKETQIRKEYKRTQIKLGETLNSLKLLYKEQFEKEMLKLKTDEAKFERLLHYNNLIEEYQRPYLTELLARYHLKDDGAFLKLKQYGAQIRINKDYTDTILEKIVEGINLLIKYSKLTEEGEYPISIMEKNLSSDGSHMLVLTSKHWEVRKYWYSRPESLFKSKNILECLKYIRDKVWYCEYTTTLGEML